MQGRLRAAGSCCRLADRCWARCCWMPQPGARACIKTLLGVTLSCPYGGWGGGVTNTTQLVSRKVSQTSSIVNRGSPGAVEKQQKLKKLLNFTLVQRNRITSRYQPTKPCPAFSCEAGLVLSEHAWDPDVLWCYPIWHMEAQSIQPFHQSQLSILWVQLLPASSHCRAEIPLKGQHPGPSPICSSSWDSVASGRGNSTVCCAPPHLLALHS